MAIKRVRIRKEDDIGREEYFGDIYDVIKRTIESHTPIKSKVGTDAILANLSLAEKEYIIERVEISYDVEELQKKIWEKWKRKDVLFTKDILKDIDDSREGRRRNPILREGKKIGHDFMVKPMAIATLSRNDPNNFMMEKILGRASLEEEEAKEESGNVLKRMWRKIRGKEEPQVSR